MYFIKANWGINIYILSLVLFARPLLSVETDGRDRAKKTNDSFFIADFAK